MSDQQPETPAGVDARVPSLGSRFGALVIDWLLCVVLAVSLVRLTGAAGWELATPAVLVAEYALFVGLFAQTPGMRVAKLRCVSVVDGGPVGILRAGLRGVLLCLLVPPLVMDADRRGLHDLAARSVVVHA